VDDTISTTDGPAFDFDSGALCLAFANTIPDRPQCTSDKLLSYDHLVAWGVQSGTLTRGEAGPLLRAARRYPDLTARAMQSGVALRESVYRIFSSRAAGVDPASDDLAVLNRSLGQAMAHLRVGVDPAGFRWCWSNDRDVLERVVWPVARSAGDLLVSNDLQWVRECASETCSWLFLDTSRTRRRKWCDMSSCGNREKARRHYRRKKAASP
jgi:predicted RNA-binding Zn ribbon-like protein